MIKAQNISYKIGEKTIIENINLEINCGEITTILGANGAGKSTLLKCLSGMIKQSDGEIFFDHKKIGDYSVKELAKKRAVLSQSNPVTFAFSVSEIVAMGRNPYSDRFEKGNEKIIEEALKQVDALHLKNRIFFTLSGGEQQRVQLARVLVQIWRREKAYLFLDEPTSALDLKHQYELLKIIKNLVKDYEIAVIAILHDINLAANFSDKAILLKAGKLFKYGLKKDVLNEENLAEIFDVQIKSLCQENQNYFFVNF